MVLPEGVTLTIKVANGQVRVDAPLGILGDKLICYALLEAAKDAVRDFVASQQKLVQPANSMPQQKAN